MTRAEIDAELELMRVGRCLACDLRWRQSGRPVCEPCLDKQDGLFREREKAVVAHLFIEGVKPANGKER